MNMFALPLQPVLVCVIGLVAGGAPPVKEKLFIKTGVGVQSKVVVGPQYGAGFAICPTPVRGRLISVPSKSRKLSLKSVKIFIYQ